MAIKQFGLGWRGDWLLGDREKGEGREGKEGEKSTLLGKLPIGLIEIGAFPSRSKSTNLSVLFSYHRNLAQRYYICSMPCTIPGDAIGVSKHGDRKKKKKSFNYRCITTLCCRSGYGTCTLNGRRKGRSAIAFICMRTGIFCCMLKVGTRALGASKQNLVFILFLFL